jgi:hypothetical protein
MTDPRRRWSFGLRTLLGLFAISVILSLIFMAHGVATGVLVPYLDPTPEQAAYEHLHGKISDWLFNIAALGWACGLLCLLLVAISLFSHRVRGRPTL